jgi:hypothetical protein
VKFKYNVKLGERFSNITADIMGIKTNGQVMGIRIEKQSSPQISNTNPLASCLTDRRWKSRCLRFLELSYAT